MKYLILNIAGIGDFFELIRWLYLLREKEKDSLIDIVVSDRVYDYAKRCPYVNNVYFLKSERNHIPFDLRIFSVIFKLKNNNYDYVINTTELSFWGSIKMRLFLSLLKRKKTLGIGNLFYDEFIDDDKTSIYFAYKLLFEKIGVKDLDISQDILWYNKASNDDILKEHNYSKLVFINLRGNTLTNRWLVDRWKNLIEEVSNSKFIFVFFGIKRDEDYIDEVINSLKKDVNVVKLINLCFDDWISLVKKSDLIISVDSATVHIASLFNKPTIVISGPVDPDRTIPYNNKSVRFIYKKVFCSPCNYFICPNKNDDYMLCMKQIEVDDILNKVKEFI